MKNGHFMLQNTKLAQIISKQYKGLNLAFFSAKYCRNCFE